MKAITLHQPWATLMAMGVKRIETRSWPTRYRGPLAIHAAKTFPAYAKDFCYSQGFRRAMDWPSLEIFIESDRETAEQYGCVPSDPGRIRQEWMDETNARIKALPLGAIVATCTLINCIDTDLIPRFISPFSEQEQMFGNYDPGRFGWITEGIRPFDTPIPVLGQRGLWEWDSSALPARTELLSELEPTQKEGK